VPDAAAMSKLHALGYVGGSAPPVAATPLDPKDMVLRWQQLLGDIVQLVQSGDFSAAIPRLREALDMTPNDPELWSMLSDAQSRQGLFDDAITSLMRTIELHPNADADNWVKLARLQLSRGEEQDASAAEVSLEHAEQLDGSNGGAPMLRAELAMRDGRSEEALRLAARARELDPSRQTSESWLLEGRVYQARQQRREARAAFERAYEANPDEGGAALELARMAFESREFAQAVKLARGIGSRRGEWAESRLLLARAYLALERDDRAVATMEELVKASPESASVRTNQGNVYYQLEKYEEAAEAYRQAAELDKKDAVARYSLGNALRRLGQDEAAVEQYEAALTIDPAIHQAAIALARIDARAGRTEAALARLRELIEQGVLTRERAAADEDFAGLADRLKATSQPSP
jgi:tetratricopeptide (TPR) repeat protein